VQCRTIKYRVVILINSDKNLFHLSRIYNLNYYLSFDVCAVSLRLSVLPSVQKKLLNSLYFFETIPMPTPPNCKTQPRWVQGIHIVAKCHTLSGFAFSAFHLVAMATLHLRALHKTKTCSSERIFISCQPRLKKPIYYNLVFIATMLTVIYAK
jgi:hypothetical protein